MYKIKKILEKKKNKIKKICKNQQIKNFSKARFALAYAYLQTIFFRYTISNHKYSKL